MNLIISRRNIKHIPKITNIRELWCIKNKIRQIPKLLTLKVTNLYFTENRIKSCKRSTNAVFIDLSGNKIKDFSYFNRSSHNDYLRYLMWNEN